MTDPRDGSRGPGVPRTPRLPETESPPPEEVLSSVPSKETLIDDARAVDEIIGAQQSVDELLHRDR